MEQILIIEIIIFTGFIAGEMCTRIGLSRSKSIIFNQALKD
jgi:hypothetical protein